MFFNTVIHTTLSISCFVIPKVQTQYISSSHLLDFFKSFFFQKPVAEPKKTTKRTEEMRKFKMAMRARMQNKLSETDTDEDVNHVSNLFYYN